MRTGPDLNKINLLDNIPSVLTKRMVISQTCSVYDPLGFLPPLPLKAKFLLRDTVQYEAKIGWVLALAISYKRPVGAILS